MLTIVTVYMLSRHFHIIGNEYNITRTLGSTRQLNLHYYININQLFLHLTYIVSPLGKFILNTNREL